MESGTEAVDEREEVAHERLQQLKTILFGEEQRGMRAGLERVEGRLDDAVHELRAEVDRRLADLDARMRARLDAVAAEVAALARSSADRAELSDLLEDLARRIRGSEDARG